MLLGRIFYFSALFIFSLFSDCSISMHGGLRKGDISTVAYIILIHFLRAFTPTLHITLCYKLHAVSLEPFLWAFLGVSSIIHHSCCKSLGTNILCSTLFLPLLSFSFSFHLLWFSCLLLLFFLPKMKFVILTLNTFCYFWIIYEDRNGQKYLFCHKNNPWTIS